MLELLLKTDAGIAGVLLRCLLAIAIFPHGAQKALGWYGGFGIAGTLGYFKGLGIPTPIGVLGIAAEFLGPLLLVAGFGTRGAAFGIACMMLGAAWLVHRPYGFFLNWFGQHPLGKVAGEDFTRKIEPGTIAFQAHDPNSIVRYKNVRVRKL